MSVSQSVLGHSLRKQMIGQLDLLPIGLGLAAQRVRLSLFGEQNPHGSWHVVPSQEGQILLDWTRPRKDSYLRPPHPSFLLQSRPAGLHIQQCPAIIIVHHPHSTRSQWCYTYSPLTHYERGSREGEGGGSGLADGSGRRGGQFPKKGWRT